jgi:rhodanese-related sulfurtransferase
MPDTILPDSLVSTEWLMTHLDEPNLRVVDIRGYVNSRDLGGGKQVADYVGARDEYDAGHIPGAVYVDWTVDIIDPDNPVKVQIAPPHRFAEAMESRGIGDDTDVVVLDHTGGHFATRFWWALPRSRPRRGARRRVQQVATGKPPADDRHRRTATCDVHAQDAAGDPGRDQRRRRARR